MKVEVITDPAMFRDGAAMLKAMIAASPIETRVRTEYKGDCDLLMTYGLGHAVRRVWWLQHLASKRHGIGVDLGYWRPEQKEALNRPMRVTIDHDHPQAWIEDEPPGRWDTARISLRNDYKENGHIVIVGLGAKTNIQLKQSRTTWERTALDRVLRVYPNADVVYRPKTEDGTKIPGTRTMAGMPIEQVLKGASLVVCKHSNVAVDACIAGIPVVCEDGAALALYGNNLSAPVRPTYEQRQRFLRNLAWWQWRPSEAAQCWHFLLSKIEARDDYESRRNEYALAP